MIAATIGNKLPVTAKLNPTKLYNNERTQLIEYKKLYNHTTKMCKVHYEKVKEIKKKGIINDNYLAFGRVNPDRACGLFSIRREVRQTLCKEYLIDIDIDNAHPSILLQICKKNEIDCEYLEEYVNDRESIFKRLIKKYETDRDSVKKLFIQLMYYGSFESWIKEKNIKNEESDKFINKFKKELQEIGEVIMEKNKEIVEFVENRKKDCTSR